MHLARESAGNNGTQSWQDGYVKLLTPMGYDVCYVSPPVSAERALCKMSWRAC